MAKFGRVENGIVLEVVEAADAAALAEMFHADIVATMIEDPNNEIEEGWEHDGSNFSAPAPVDNTPTVEMIKSEAARRITESGHDWMIIREVSTGGAEPCPQNIKDYAAAIRADSLTLEGTLPEDYTDDSHWTAAP